MMPWTKWFAWYPVKITHGREMGTWAWMEYVEYHDWVQLCAYRGRVKHREYKLW